METSTQSSRFRLEIGLLGLALTLGIFLRVWPSSGFHGVGNDEHMYATYVGMAEKGGVLNYAEVIRAYFLSQAKRSQAIVPATRVGFLWPAAVVAKITK